MQNPKEFLDYDTMHDYLRTIPGNACNRQLENGLKLANTYIILSKYDRPQTRIKFAKVTAGLETLAERHFSINVYGTLFWSDILSFIRHMGEQFYLVLHNYLPLIEGECGTANVQHRYSLLYKQQVL